MTGIRSYYISFNTGKGKFLKHPINNTINIDFTLKWYGIKNSLHFYKYKGSIKYLVSNLKENKIAYFSYKDSKYNPFKVCHGIEYPTNLSKYNFIKGEEYRIEISFQEYACFDDDEDCYYRLYAFSICSSLNLKIILFILLFLLLILFYH